MKPFQQKAPLSAIMAVNLLIASATFGQGSDRLLGIWAYNDGVQNTELLFRSDGRYQLDSDSTNPDLDFSSTERGRYQVAGTTLTLTPYDFFGEPQHKQYEIEVTGGNLSLRSPDLFEPQRYHFKPGSRANVLAWENVSPVLPGRWERQIEFVGTNEYTFRPGGYYMLQNTPEDTQFPPEFIRGRYEQDGHQLTLKPYSLPEVTYEIDFFGNALTFIKIDQFSGESMAFGEVPGSKAEVSAKSEAAAAFLNRENWQAGVWEIRDGVQTVDLTIRPDNHYSAENYNQVNRGIVRGRYTLESKQIHFAPFVGQDLYARSNGEFGKVARTREWDYYDGEWQFIDLDAISQSVTIARKRVNTEAVVVHKVRQAQIEREREDWYVGIWQVEDPAGWMQFTMRPDRRYIAESGVDGEPEQVERGRYLVRDDKVTLAPYAGLGPPRGFELDFYDNDLFLIGDFARMVIARKMAGSEDVVIEKTNSPEAMLGERGSILGLWTANLPGQSVELVFRPDGQFRLSRCTNNEVSRDYGLYTANMAARTLVYDSRFIEAQSYGLDFYGDTMTLYGGTLGPPSTYTVNLGGVDAAVHASIVEDAIEAEVDEQWLTRVPIGPRDEGAQIPTSDIPADPYPEHVFDAPAVLTNYALYRRLISSLVFFNDLGTIRSVPVVNTREWHFFPNGRTHIRFKNHRAGSAYPVTEVDVTASWGAYRVEPNSPAQSDILHIYADNSVFIETDTGERTEMTLEDGRRHLFLNKDYQILSEWASERNSEPCQSAGEPDRRLLNTSIMLSTGIEPDEVDEPRAEITSPIEIQFTDSASGNFIISGTTDIAGTIITERTISQAPPIIWEMWQTNASGGGRFSFQLPKGTDPVALFRFRTQ